jgi:hypothetical protein
MFHFRLPDSVSVVPGTVRDVPEACEIPVAVPGAILDR